MLRLARVYGRWTAGIIAASVLLAAGGTAASLGWAWHEATRAETQWRERAWREASALTEDIHRELLQVEAQMRALSVLFLASDHVDAAELLAAEAVVPAGSNSAAVEGLAYAKVVPMDGRNAPGTAADARSAGYSVPDGPEALTLPVSLGSGTHRMLRPGLDLATLRPFQVPAVAAIRQRGVAVMGPAYRNGQRWFAAFAITAANAGDQGVLFGVLDLQSMFDWTLRRATPGLELRLHEVRNSRGYSEASDAGGPGRDLLTIIGPEPGSEEPVSRHVERIEHGNAKWLFEWQVFPQYRGGVEYHPAWMAAIGGSLLSLLVAAAIATLTHQNAMIRQQVERRTAELSNAVTRLEQVSKAKTNFLSIVGHELRTPLNAVIGFTELLERKQTDEASRTKLRFVLGGGRHLLGLINDLLDVAHAESGQIRLDETEADPAALIRSVAGGLEAMAAGSDVRLSIETESDLPHIRVDKGRLRQALECLCHNALAASPPGSQIELSVGRTAPDGAIAFRVTDHGQGMSDDQLDTALELFAQVEDPLVRRWEGLGIGLPLCRHLVELHGGQLRFVTRPGEGTAAIIELPACRAVGPLTEAA